MVRMNSETGDGQSPKCVGHKDTSQGWALPTVYATIWGYFDLRRDLPIESKGMSMLK